VELDAVCRSYCDTMVALEPVQEWMAAALAEPEEIDELEAEF
jgi:glutathione S-transferase